MTQRGFSLIEAIVVLTIASLVLVSVLEVSSRAASRNARLAREINLQADRQLDQTMFRDLLSAAMPPLQSEPGRAPRYAGEGDASTLSFVASIERPSACAGTGAYENVRFVILESGPSGGGTLVCEGKRGRYPLASWRSGEASFSYSIDGLNWQSRYPVEAEEDSFFDRADRLGGRNRDLQRILDGESQRPLIVAPIVRLEFGQGPAREVWAARLGVTQLAPIQRTDFFGRERSDPFLDLDGP